MFTGFSLSVSQMCYFGRSTRRVRVTVPFNTFFSHFCLHVVKQFSKKKKKKKISLLTMAASSSSSLATPSIPSLQDPAHGFPCYFVGILQVQVCVVHGRIRRRFHKEMVGLGLVMGSLTEAHFRFRSENDRHCSVFLILCFPTVQGTNNYSTELKVEQRVEVDLRGS